MMSADEFGVRILGEANQLGYNTRIEFPIPVQKENFRIFFYIIQDPGII